MKLRIFLSLVLIGFILFLGWIPALVLSHTTTCDFTYPVIESYEKKVTASGEIQLERMQEIYLEVPVIANQVNVTVGDYVTAGQVLATVDTELTRSVISQSLPVESYFSGFDLSQLAEIAKLYGVSEEEIQAVMGTQGFGVGQQTTEVEYVPPVIDVYKRQV